MRVLEILVGENPQAKKQFLIGKVKEFIELSPNMKFILQPDFVGCVDYCTYNELTNGEDVGIPVMVPKTYDMGDFSLSPSIEDEERKNDIIKSYEVYGVQVLKWEEVNLTK